MLSNFVVKIFARTSVFFVLVCFVLFLPEITHAWLDDFNYRKSITIAGSTAGAQTFYSIPIIVNYGSGTDSGINIYLDSKSQTDFDDIRFTASDEATELDYYLDQKIDGDKALIWIEVDSIPADPDTATIYIYYGDTGVSSESNGGNTFVSWEDFEDATFIFDTAGAVNIALGISSSHSPKEGSNVGVNSGSQGYKKRMDSSISLGDGYIVGSWVKTLSGGSTNENLGPGVTIYGATGGVNNGYEAINDLRSSVSPQIREAWDYGSRTNGNFSPSYDTWYFVTLYDGGSTIKSGLYSEAQMYTQLPQTTTSRSDTTYSSGYAGIGTYNANHSVWDAWRVRKYVEPEPSVSSYGGEESAPSGSVSSVQTRAATNVGPSSANVHGAIVSDGGASVTEHGFAYSTNENLTTDTSTTTLGALSLTEFSQATTTLSAATIYYYRAYATNSGGTGLGAINSFTTGNTTVSRKMRLFGGFMMQFLEGRIRLFGH